MRTSTTSRAFVAFVPRTLLVLLAAGSAVAGGASCQGEYIGDTRAARRLEVELVAPSKTGDRDAPLPLTPQASFRVIVRAIRQGGGIDTDFTGYVRLSVKPGAIAPLTSEDTEGRNVLLTDGESKPVDVLVTSAYGTTFIVADDLGYVPADPLRGEPPACANGVDDDGDGRIDFPADEGCAFANDDAEQGGGFAEGVSAPIFFASPRIADARGLVCLEAIGCSSNGATPYPKDSIQLDTGFRIVDEKPKFLWNTVVTRIASNGFYATDTGDTRAASPDVPNGAFTSIFVFNFNAPSRMRVCDRLKALNGTAAEFFGFTQLSYPTWVVEEWDARFRRCLVPAPSLLGPSDIYDQGRTNRDLLLRLSGGLVRVETAGDQTVRVTPKFGPGDMQRTPSGAFVPSADATNCDFNGNGNVEFDVGNPEKDCSDACTADAECTEYSNYKARSNFRLTVTDTAGGVSAIQADATASASFDPLASKGQTLRAFTGTLHYFSGGSQFTIEARCKDDIITDLNQTPFGTDDRTDLSLPPPPLACVLPRTDLELNPQ